MTRARIPSLSFRLQLGDDLAIGPGKTDLLEAIAATGSISAAGRNMGMSYKRAWQLVDELNQGFAEPLVLTSRGGGHGGGATLSATGLKVLAIYRRIESKMQKTIATELRALQRLRR